MTLRSLIRIFALFAVVVLYGLLGMVNYWPKDALRPSYSIEFSWPVVTSGDEPIYLAIIHSLLFDHDIRLDNNYAQIAAGGNDGGSVFRGMDIGGHSFLTNPATGAQVRCVYPCSPADYAAVGGPRDGLYQVPAHPVAYPLLMALLAWPFSPTPDNVEALVGIISIVIAIAGVVLTFAAARSADLAEPYAYLAAGLVGFASPWLVYMRSYYADPSIGLFLILAYLALRRGWMVLAAVGVAVAMAMKPVFVLFGALWIAERFLARDRRAAIVLAATLGGLGLALVAVNMATIGRPLASGALPLMWAKDLSSLWNTFFDLKYGLILFVPWTAIALAWGVAALFPQSGGGEPGAASAAARRQIVLPVVGCTAVFAALAFGPGFCYGPRYYVPLFPLLAILAADFLAAHPVRWRQAAIVVLGIAGLVIAVSSAPQYHRLLSVPFYASITDSIWPAS